MKINITRSGSLYLVGIVLSDHRDFFRNKNKELPLAKVGFPNCIAVTNLIVYLLTKTGIKVEV